MRWTHKKVIEQVKRPRSSKLLQDYGWEVVEIEGSNYAILIGGNTYNDSLLAPLTYAEKDCLDMYETLTDPSIGRFSTTNTSMLLGAEATTRNVQDTLLDQVVTNRTQDDVVLVYFSGHGFITGSRQKAYLATSDVSLTSLLSQPNAGIAMDFLHDAIFMASPAQHVLFILDCCHSGAFIPPKISSRGERPIPALIDNRFFSGGIGRVALVACPPDTASRENASLQNGIFTHYLLRGLRGEAVESTTGEVTLDSLCAYVRAYAPPEQPPGRYGQDYGRIVLTKPGKKQYWQFDANTALNSIEPRGKEILQNCNPLSNPLEEYEPLLSRVTAFLGNQTTATSREPEHSILEAIRRASYAEFAFLLRIDEDSVSIRAHSNLSVDYADTSTYVESVMSFVQPIISNRVIFGHDRYGTYVLRDEGAQTKDNNAIVIVPLRESPVTEIMFVCGLPQESSLLEEPYARILTAIYTASRELTLVDNSLIEAAMIDDLKTRYGFVPITMYNRRYQLFCERLKDTIVHFQPVLYLHPNLMRISGWEALARDPGGSHAPVDLFDAVEKWGHKFMVALDKYYLELAITSYHKTYLKLHGQSDVQDIYELSVNVYPESLMREAYFDLMRDILQEGLILPEKLVLEISEKQLIPEEQGGSGIGWAFNTFRERLKRYVSDFQISFAVDDFSVGFASPSRLAWLNPSHVKIDRDALQHEFSDLVISFVVALTGTKRLEPTRVVVEGFDGSSLVSLEALYDLGIRHIQGFLVGRGGPDITGLDPGLKDHLVKLISVRHKKKNLRPSR